MFHVEFLVGVTPPLIGSACKDDFFVLGMFHVELVEVPLWNGSTCTSNKLSTNNTRGSLRNCA